MPFLLIAAAVLIVGYIIFVTIENNTLTSSNTRLQKELRIVRARNINLVEPLEAISKQEPLTALKMLRSLVERNK